MRKGKKLFFLSLCLVLLFSTQLLTAGGKQGEVSAPEPRVISYLTVWPETDRNNELLLGLTDQYMKENPGKIKRVDVDVLPSGEVVHKMQILIASNDIPDWFAYGAGTVLAKLIDAGFVVDIEKEFTKLGIMDSLEVGAVSLLKSLVDGRGLYCLPLGWNIEGIWYNKTIYEKYGLSVPKTWAELEANAAKLHAAGVQPFSAAGKERWPLTRHINMLVMRNVGYDAMTRAGNGEISFMQPGFIDAAQRIQDWALAGWFGPGVNTLDYGTARDVFVTGGSAMFYMGSWFLQDLTNPEVNKIGPKEVGFFNFPPTEFGMGTTDDYSVNCGAILALSAAGWDDTMADWASYVFPKFGDLAMKDYGSLMGYRVTTLPDDMPYYTQLVLDEMTKVVNAGLWFEAKMDEKTGDIAKTNSQSLFLGEMTAEEYFQQIQDATDEFLAEQE